MSRAKSFFSELRRRRVVRAVVLYSVTAWILIQIASETFGPLHLPEWSITLVVMLAILGFPVVIVLAWAFDLTPEGLRADTGDAPAAAAEAATPGRVASRHSIAVLPFADMSPERDQSYFCEGVAEEILNFLTCIPGLQVASRLSSFQFAGNAGDVGAIGTQLNVRHVLQGSVRKADDRLRVTAQLIDVDNGFHVWAERYDRQMSDVFAIQDDIAHSIVDALELKLQPGLPLHAARPSGDVEAYEYYLRGRQFFHRHGRKDFEMAAQMFRRAIDIDPDYALAWAGLADANAFTCLYLSCKEQGEDNVNSATSASKRAVALAPALAEAHASRGLALLLCKRYAEAESEFDEAIRLNPMLFEAYYFYARASVHQGKMAQAEEYFRKASNVRPEDYQALLLLSRIYYGQGDTTRGDEAARRGIAVARKRLSLYPDDLRAMYLMAGALLKLGERERAQSLIDRVLELDSEDGVVLYNVGCYYAQAGEPDKALDFLFNVGRPTMANPSWMRHDDDLAPLRDHPRFEQLLSEYERQS